MAGAWITLIGAAITLFINYFFIPYFSYMACAWATFACYGSMMVVSFIWGQKEYPIPYAWKKLLAYIVIVVLIYFAYSGVIHLYNHVYFNFIVSTCFLLSFIWFILLTEKKEFQRLPVIGKYMQ